MTDTACREAWREHAACGGQVSRRSRNLTAAGCSLGLHLAAVFFVAQVIEGPLKLVLKQSGTGPGHVPLTIILESASTQRPATDQGRTAAHEPIIRRLQSGRAANFKRAAPASDMVPGFEASPSSPVPQAVSAGMQLPRSTGLTVPGHRRPFMPVHEGLPQSQSQNPPAAEAYHHGEDGRLARQIFLRQEGKRQVLVHWMAQLRQALEPIEVVTCRLDGLVTCDPQLPEEVQALLEQGLAQWRTFQPQARYRLSKAEGRWSFEEDSPIPAAPDEQTPST